MQSTNFPPALPSMQSSQVQPAEQEEKKRKFSLINLVVGSIFLALKAAAVVSVVLTAVFFPTIFLFLIPTPLILMVMALFLFLIVRKSLLP